MTTKSTLEKSTIIIVFKILYIIDRRKGICLLLFYKIVNHEINVTSEGILILVKWGIRKSNTQYIYAYSI